MEHGFGSIPSPKDIRDYKLNTETMYQKINSKAVVIPDTYKLTTVPIKNQGIFPTCVAHALSEIVEFHNKRQSGKFSKFSTEFIYGCRFEGDYDGEGMYIRDALKVIKSYGDVLYTVLPGNSYVQAARSKVLGNFDELKVEAYPNRVSNYYRLYGETEVKYAIVKNGPVVAGMWWYDGATLDDKHIYIYNKDNDKSGHAVLIVGWDNENWIIQNSWGGTWGDKGLFKIPINKSFDEVFYEVYGVNDNITDIKTPSKFIEKISPAINSILNTLKKWFKK